MILLHTLKNATLPMSITKRADCTVSNREMEIRLMLGNGFVSASNTPHNVENKRQADAPHTVPHSVNPSNSQQHDFIQYYFFLLVAHKNKQRNSIKEQNLKSKLISHSCNDTE